MIAITGRIKVGKNEPALLPDVVVVVGEGLGVVVVVVVVVVAGFLGSSMLQLSLSTQKVASICIGGPTHPHGVVILTLPWKSRQGIRGGLASVPCTQQPLMNAVIS